MQNTIDADALISGAIAEASAVEKKSTEKQPSLIDAESLIADAISIGSGASKEGSSSDPSKSTDQMAQLIGKKEEELSEMDQAVLGSIIDPKQIAELPPHVRLTDKQKRALWEHERAQKFLTWENAKAAGAGFWEFAKSIGRAGLTVIDAIPMTTEIPDPEEAKEKSDKLTKVISDVLAPVAGLPLSIAELAIERENGSRFNDWFYEKFGSQTPEQSFQNWSRRRDTEQAFASYKQKYPSTFHRLLNTYEFPREAAAVIGAAFDNRQDIDWNTKKQQAREIVDNYVRDAKFGPENPDVYALGTLVAPEGSGMGTFGATMMAGRALREGVPALASGIGSVARGSAASAAIKTAEAAAALNRAEAMTVAATDAGVDFTPDVIAQINKQSTQGGLSGWTPVGRPAAEVEAVSRVGTFGRSANEVNAINEAKAAVARDKFAAEVNQRFTKPGLAERAATEVDAKLMAASEKVKGIAEKVPETLKFLAPYAAGGTVAGVVSEGDPAQTLLGTVGLRFAGKLAANAPAATAAILKARRLSTGGRIGTFEMLGKTIDEASPKTRAVFRESGPIIDKTLNNLADISLEGANAGLIAIASGVLDSSTPEEIAELVGQGFLFAAKGKVLSKAKSIFFQNPAMAQREVRQARIDAAKQFNSLSPASKEGLIGVADWNLEIARNQAILERKIAERDAATGEERSKLDVEVAAREKAIDQLKRADSATRDFFTRDIVRQVGELSGFVNGMTRAGQNDLRIEILEPADMAQLVLKGRNASELKPDEAELLSAILSKQGFYAEPGEGGIDPMRPTIAVSAPRIRSRMLSRGQTVSDALAHEVGHHLHNVPEFNERMATAYKLLFGIRREDAAGNVYEEKPGMYSDSDLLERFDQYAQRAKGESDAQFKARRDQLARDAGLFDEKSGTLNEAAVIDYMKKELIADLAGRGLTSGILTKDSKMRRAMDLALVEAKMGVLDSIRAKIGSVLFDNAKYADDPNQFEGFTGVKFTPEVEAAVRNALREMREMDGLVARMEEEGEGPKISRVELMKSKALRDRYGKDSGLFKVVFEAQAYDAAGNPVGKPVEVSGTDVMEGIWKNSSGVTMPMEKSNQTEGFGALPGALRAAPVPAGGTVKIRSRIATEADGVTPILLTPKETKQVLRSRKEAINAALDTPDQGTPGRFEPVREGSETYRGTFTPLQIQAIKNIPESILPRSMKARMLEINDLVAKADGTRLFIDYAAMMNDNGKYQAFSPRLYDVIPIGMHMSKAGNFLVTTISYGRLLSKLNLWSERMPNRLSLWNGNKEVFMDEFINKYLMNWQYREQDATGRELYPRGRPGEFGLDSNPDVALQKKDIFNDFLNQTTSETPETAPRTRIPRRRGDPRGKDLDRTIMSVRIDHVTDMAVNESGQKVPINYGNAVRSFAPEQAAEAQQERQEAIDRGLRVLGIRRPGTMRFAPEDKPETGFFYSKLDNLVYEKMPRIATKEQVMALIDPKRGSGIKPDEIKWRGVEQAIERIASENNGKVPKDALDRYLRLESSLDFRRSEYKGKQLFQLENLETGDVEIYDTREQALAAVNNAALSIAEDRYRIEKQENGTWYRVEDLEGFDSQTFSSLEKAEQKRKILVREFVREFSDNYEINESFESGTHYSDLVSPGNSSNYKEVIITSPASRYTSHHPGFDETPNYVSHYRSTDRVDSNGINGFFIEEIQSDLHQSAKKKGYSSLNNEQLEELNNEAEALQNKANESEQLAIDYIGKLRLLEGMLVEQVIFKTLEVAEKEGILNIDARESYVKRFLAELYFSVRPEYRQKWLEDAYQSMELKYYKSEVSSQRENAKELMEKIGNNIADSDSVAKIYKGMIKWNELYQEETKESKRLEEEALKKRQEFNYENRKISDAPFRGDWPLQTFKRALADAVSDGKKWIGWTDGKTQADRYSLERAISSIRIDKQDSQFSQFNKGERSLTIELETGRDIKYVYFPDGSIAGIEVGKKLSDVIGDELAGKVLSANEGDRISGEDLKVGGEGMRGFYDKILPNEVAKYVKQWGAKVEKSTIPTNGKQNADIWRVDISPDMADSIKRVGQPRFAPESVSDRSEEALRKFRDRFPKSRAEISSVGRMYSPAVRGMLSKERSSPGSLDRRKLQAEIDRDIPVQAVEIPTAETLPDMNTILDAVGEKGRGRVMMLDAIPAGSKITIRQDVPSFNRKRVGVVTVAGKDVDGERITTYEPFVVVENPQMVPTPGMEQTALKIGAGADKVPTIAISGTKAEVQELPDNLSEWTQVGFNPDRHSYYYDRADGATPIIGGKRAVQVGNTVFVEDAVRGEKSTFRFAPDGADLSAEKASVRFVPEEMDTRAKFRFLMRNKEKKPVPTQEQLDERKARLPEYTTQIDTEKVGNNTWYKIFVIPADGTTANIYGSRVGMAAFGEFMVAGDKPEMLQVALTELGPEPKYEQKGYGEILYREAAKLAQRIGATQLYGAPTSDSAALRREKMFETELGRKTPSGFTYSSSKIDPNIRFSPEGQLEIESDGRPVPTQQELNEMKARLPKYRTVYDIEQVENFIGELPTEMTRISIMRDDNTVAAVADVIYNPAYPEVLQVGQTYIKDPAKNAKQGYGEALYREIARHAQNSGATTLYGEPVSQKAAIRREKLFKTELGRSDSGGYSWASSEVPASVRFSPERASEMDADYLDAVSRGDTETAKQIVDEAAKAAGLVKVWNQGPRPIRGNKIETPFFYSTESSKPLFSLSDIPHDAWYIDLGNVLYKDLGSGAFVNWKNNPAYYKDGKWTKLAYEDEVVQMYQMAEAEAKEAMDAGYDTIAEPSEVDSGTLQFIAMRPNQIKSSEAITRDDAGNIIPPSKRFDIAKPDIRFAPERAEQMDSDYFDAVNRGDSDEINRIIDSAAKSAGYSIGPVYHGTTADFSEFKTPAQFSRDREYSSYLGDKVIPAYLDLKNIADLRAMNLSPSDPNFKKIAERLKSEGYDGAQYRDVAFIAFEPSQIKSAQPITRDGDGNIIPLSRRFDITRPDIRFAPEEERATIGRSIDQIDAASSETRKAVQASADTLPYPANPVPESVALVPRWGLINEKIVGMPKNQADVIDILDRSIMRLKRLVESNPSFARESARFYRDMGESALLLADLTDPQLDVYERFMLADLNNRFLALGSPRTGVSANASKSQSSAVARSGGFSAGWKIGFGSQQEGAKRTAEAWKRGEHFDLSMEGVQDKVRSFYLNGLSEIIEMAEEGRDAETDPGQREKYQRVVDELNLRAAKSMRIVDANATALTDEQKADIQRLLDGKATVDMWDMAAKGFAWPGWISNKAARGNVADRGFHWTQEKFAVEKTMADPEWKAALAELGYASPADLRYQEARSFRIDGNKDWDAASWEKRRKEPFGENTSWTDFTERTEAGLSPGGGGPLYDAQQGLDGMMADRLNQLGMAELFGKRKLKARNAQEILWALEKLDNPLKGNNDLSLYGNSFKSLRNELMKFRSGEPMDKESRGVDVLAASQRVYKEMAEQVMPLEAVTKGKSKNAQVIQQQIEKLRQAGDPNPERTFTLHVANNLHNEVNAIAKKHGVDFTIDKIEPSYGGYTEGEMDISENFIITARGNIFDREKGAFPAAYAFLEGYSRGADQAAGNVIRRASLRELYTPEIEGKWTVVSKSGKVVSSHEKKESAQKELESLAMEKRDYKVKLKELEKAKKSKDKTAIKAAKDALEKELQKQVAGLELSVTRVLPFKQATVLSFDTRHLDDAQIKAFANELGMIKDSKGGFFINGFSKTANGIVIHDGFYSGDMAAEVKSASDSINEIAMKYGVGSPSIDKSVVEMFFRGQDSDQITESPFTKDVQKLVEKKIRSKTITPAPARQVRDVILDWAADAKALKAKMPSMSKSAATLAIATLNSRLDAAVLRGDITRAESLSAKAEKGFGAEKEPTEDQE